MVSLLEPIYEREFLPFSFGFTHYGGKTRRGRYVVKPKTAGKRFRRALDSIGQWCREHRHVGLREQ